MRYYGCSNVCMGTSVSISAENKKNLGGFMQRPGIEPRTQPEFIDLSLRYKFRLCVTCYTTVACVNVL
jgi:hypothetical protein